MMKTRRQLLSKAADILDKLAEKCGGEGGTPGPCPLGNASESKPKPASAPKVSSTATLSEKAIAKKSTEIQAALKKNKNNKAMLWVNEFKEHNPKADLYPDKPGTVVDIHVTNGKRAGIGIKPFKGNRHDASAIAKHIYESSGKTVSIGIQLGHPASR